MEQLWLFEAIFLTPFYIYSLYFFYTNVFQNSLLSLVLMHLKKIIDLYFASLPAAFPTSRLISAWMDENKQKRQFIGVHITHKRSNETKKKRYVIDVTRWQTTKKTQDKKKKPTQTT